MISVFFVFMVFMALMAVVALKAFMAFMALVAFMGFAFSIVFYGNNAIQALENKCITHACHASCICICTY